MATWLRQAGHTVVEAGTGGEALASVAGGRWYRTARSRHRRRWRGLLRGADVRDKLLIAIGGVQGHSLPAATIMGELRHAIGAFAAEDHQPETISRLVNDVLQRYHPNIVATLCLALVDPPTVKLTLINCGHIPPLIVADGVAQFLGQGGLLLGLPMHDPHAVTAVLPVGGTILLITDGLVEERHVQLDDNLERLRAAAEEVSSAPAETFVNHLMALFGPREDDVAMIALRRTG